MKRKLIYLIIALCFLSMGAIAAIIKVMPANAGPPGMNLIVGSGGAPADGGPYSCTDATADSITETDSNEQNVGGMTGREWMSTPYTVGGSDITVCSFEFPNTNASPADTARIERGTYTGAITIHMEIWTNNAAGCGGKDCPGSLIANGASNTLSVQTDIPTSSDGTNVSFAWSTPNYPTLSASTKYWFVLRTSGDVANYIYWGATDVGACAYWYSGNGADWTEHGNAYCGTFIMKE